MKLSLGQAARAARMSKSTLQRMLADGRVSGHKRQDGVWEIDPAELQRVIDARDAPRRGKRVEAPPVEAPPPDPAAVDLAVLRAELAAARQRIEDMVQRAERAEAEKAEAVARERELADRWRNLIEDQRPARGFWSRLFGA